ncbi:putative short-chain type dehydrogenase/reductase MSMEG_6031/MSMEI_5872 [Frankia canadensis]|uniref:Putative short-chain type dehydrogenase/reductase MSMEG_6031/MSMEI_5872 n=1 Tax=Frankia canadensis TaxID=1836972 RepID=A0A2I2KIB1_9ACTN|nr:mycofactocin-coupled SDR family oxidoreductase [Frankia canadensis]SNQ45405.1 putative short-chain type dehydrogenase/reductase MSMEG_6031/MSMEI_5872 [Frankia canadensis]SOU52695.1 putative short-chain type dehydrogenase/reductase MSMEG_6031/MSMEI_5872 [Frankia canadensis]
MYDQDPMRQRLAGRTALVTGAAHGQGRAHCLRLAAEGADIVALDLCEQALKVAYPLGTWDELVETVDAVKAMGRRAVAIKADIRDRAALAAAEAASSTDFPRLDVLVCNAGMGAYGKILDTPMDLWDEVMSVNLTGTFNTVQAFAPRMLAGDGGSIIITSSVSGTKGLPFTGAYAATKHGLQGLMKVLAQELGEFGIRVNTVNPGPIRTPLTTDETGPALLSGDGHDAVLFASTFNPVLPIPANGFLEPEEVSAAVAWLASDDARFITGMAVPVDAGVMVR